jgi:threonine dehydratase
MPSYHADLVAGIAVSALDFLRHAPPLDCVYVPIGMGSGIAAMIAARDALGLKTQIIGVASDAAPAIALSFAAKKIIAHPATTRIADGLACSQPDSEAFAHIVRGAERIVRVTDDETEVAIRAAFATTHNILEGAAAAGLAAIFQDRATVTGKRVGLVATGGNIDTPVLARVLSSA